MHYTFHSPIKSNLYTASYYLENCYLFWVIYNSLLALKILVCILLNVTANICIPLPTKTEHQVSLKALQMRGHLNACYQSVPLQSSEEEIE